MNRRITFAATIIAALLMFGTVSAGASARGRAHGHLHWSATRPDVLLSIDTRHPMVALSFDDGPDPRYTPRVLSLLEAADAHATFFDTGVHVSMYPSLARQTVAAGDEVANHTWDHPVLSRLTATQVASELDRTSAMFMQTGLPNSDLFRPPYGAYNERANRAVERTGKRVIGWDLCVEKELRGRTVDAAVADMMNHVHPGSIILAHDTGPIDRSRTLEALPLLLRQLHQRGLRVVTVSTLLRG